MGGKHPIFQYNSYLLALLNHSAHSSPSQMVFTMHVLGLVDESDNHVLVPVVVVILTVFFLYAIVRKRPFLSV